MREWPEAFWLDLDLKSTLKFYEKYLSEAAGDSETYRYARSVLAKNDLFFLITDVFGRTEDQMLHPWTFERCREIQKDPDGYLDLWARDHYKSTIITFGMTILDIINDPEITIGIFSHTKSIARDFLSQIKRELEDNKDLVDLFPDVFYENPRLGASQWSLNDGIIVRRKGNPKESTIEAHGLVDGMPTGKHFALLIYDDVVTKESVSTPEQIQKTTAAFRLSSNLSMSGGRKRMIGTRYHEFDTYQVIEKEKIAKVRKHPCTLSGKGEPEDFKLGVLKSEKELRQKRKDQGSYIFGSQMLLNPNSDKTMGFEEEDLRYWEPSKEAARKMWVIILVDPSSGKLKKDGKNGKRDFTAMAVMGLGADKHWRTLDMVRDKLDLGGRQRTLEDLHREWNPSYVFYEETGFEADQDYIKIKEEENVYKMNVVPIRWSIGKDDRILMLQPEFQDHKILLPHRLVRINYEKKAENLVETFVEEEYKPYPVLAHDDFFDCLAHKNHPEVKRRIKIPKPRQTNSVSEKIEAQKRAARRNRPLV